MWHQSHLGLGRWSPGHMPSPAPWRCPFYLQLQHSRELVGDIPGVCGYGWFSLGLEVGLVVCHVARWAQWLVCLSEVSGWWGSVNCVRSAQCSLMGWFGNVFGCYEGGLLMPVPCPMPRLPGFIPWKGGVPCWVGDWNRFPLPLRFANGLDGSCAVGSVCWYLCCGVWRYIAESISWMALIGDGGTLVSLTVSLSWM